mgnify:CR=1 FL=1
MNFNINMNKLKELIVEYANTHELAVECGSEYIYQNDDAQVDALDLVCAIFDKCVEKEAD